MELEIGIASMSSLKTAQALGEAGFERKQASAIAECIHEYSVLVSKQIAGLRGELREQLAEHKRDTDRQLAEYMEKTDRQIAEIRKELAEYREKTDRQIAEICKQIAAMRERMTEDRAASETSIAKFQAANETSIAELKADMANLKTYITRMMVGLYIASGASFYALDKLLAG